MPKKLGNMSLYWYNLKTGQPKIVMGNKYMLCGSIPLVMIGIGALFLQLYGLLSLKYLGPQWYIWNYIVLTICAYSFFNVLLGNPGISRKLFEKKPVHVADEERTVGVN